MFHDVQQQAGRIGRALARRGRAATARATRTATIAAASARTAGPAGLPALARRTAHLVGTRRFGFDEAYTLGLLAPSVDDDAIDAAVSKSEMIAAQARLNPNEFWYLTEDKAIFYRLAEQLGLRVPTLYAVLCESGPGWSHTGEVLADAGDWERLLLSDALPDTFVIKPARGYYGLGVRVIERGGGTLHELGRGDVDAGALCRELVSDPQFHVYVVQERLENHPDMPGGRSALQTARIATLVDRDGGVRVINSFFKTALDGAAIDNFRLGATGNYSSVLDVRDGTFANVVGAGEGGVLTEVTPPEGVNAPRVGQKLLMWDECCALVAAAAPHFLPMRCIGWDVAVTPTGPVIVEANMWWDPVGSQRSIRDALEIMRRA
ncbi:sugar-transfer associated ATP-grasp domain-containing protein [Miltoncostaea oceani]|uniref:sugar-transfer associated ATP-grasp domain-containing protein n=1 Tax=Miltoncostaea oceani TaxID=2843216 RepID=UPI001C3E84FC|nr:sugar-transfer associated ATP-grasp domain-containing protein [Miltoncostaea oceani]